jgi:uncharacterized protein (TIGR02246 family)
MYRKPLLGAILAALFSTVPVLAQEPAGKPGVPDVPAAGKGNPPPSPEGRPESSADLAAIRATSKAFVEAFNKGDAKAIAALWTKDGDYIDDSGHTFSGRDAIEKGYAGYFADNPKAHIRIVIDNLRLLSDDAAVEDGRAMVDPLPVGAPSIGKYMVVHVKVDGKWLMSTVRDHRIETPSAYRHVADLEWLIGTWTAEENGAKNESVCRWIANKSFVQRRYTVTRPDGTMTSGVQLIGWNPEEDHVQSWNFSSDGGYAVGIWSPTAGGWSAEVHGVTGDGLPTTAVNRLKRLDDNAYVWQSVERTVNGTALPDTDEVIIKRHTTGR